MHRSAILGIGLAISALAGSALAQTPETRAGVMPPNPKAPLAAIPLRDGAYWMSGGISNSGFVIGDKGVIVIDAQTFVPAAKGVLAEIAKLTPKPVDTVILTHSDPDHINGLPAFPRGLAIIAHPNTKAVIEAVIADPKSNGLTPPAEIKDYVPTHTVRTTEHITVDGVRLVLIHTAAAHTDGDLIVFLPKQKVVYAGDLLTPAVGPYPGIHLNKQGSALGWVASIKAMLALDADIFVSGHGDPLTRVEVLAGLHAAEQRRAEIAALVARKMSLVDIKAALHDAPLAGPAARFPTFIETTYQELTSGGERG